MLFDDTVVRQQLEKPTYLMDLKRSICDAFHKYYNFPKFQFFVFGPQHSARAAAVLKVIINCDDLNSIEYILNHQIKIMKGTDFIATRIELDKFMELGLEKRYVMDNGLKNKPNDLSTSKYFRTLTACLSLVEETKNLENGIKPATAVMR
jgi:hypothetical protein